MKILLSIFFLFSINLYAANTAELDVLSPEERWKRLMALVNDEIKTIKGNKYSGAELKHRLFELYSEKIKLIRQKENEMFLKASQKSGKPIEKEKFFNTTNLVYATSWSLSFPLSKSA